MDPEAPDLAAAEPVSPAAEWADQAEEWVEPALEWADHQEAAQVRAAGEGASLDRANPVQVNPVQVNLVLAAAGLLRCKLWVKELDPLPKFWRCTWLNMDREEAAMDLLGPDQVKAMAQEAVKDTVLAQAEFRHSAQVAARAMGQAEW